MTQTSTQQVLGTIAFLLILACTPKENKVPSAESHSSILTQKLSLSTVPLGDVKTSGKRLMALSNGLHRLSSDEQESAPHLALKTKTSQGERRQLNLMVHGYGSQGYEWVYAAHQLTKRAPTYLFRWDWEVCPNEGASRLYKALEELSKTHPEYDINAFGHSYGGVILAIAAAKYRLDDPLTGTQLKAHLIASPLAGHLKLEERCEKRISELTRVHLKSAHPETENQNHRQRVQLHQWRTLKELDGAFKDLDSDPQVVDWRGEVTRLPASYKGHRLGHNWSISAVIDELFPPAM